MSDYTPTIGLEIHAELKTNTKMFCACRNDPNERRPNTNICPICMAHPGSLPAINYEAVRKVLVVGRALSATVADYTEFDRKNYFYPDIPKGYQISQYAYPLVSGGSLRDVAITRIHLEEDTARSQHLAAVGEQGEASFVDYNRAGVPLMELVTEPVIHSPEQAGAFARELQLLLRSLGAGDANMEKGEMRVEANISVSRDATLGTKVEVKNLNSFRSVERAIAYEVTRQMALIESGGAVSQETRGWDEAKQSTFSQRKKESSHDYRYFPDPDLPKLLLSEISDFSVESLDAQMPTLPWERRAAYLSMQLKSDDAELFVRDAVLGAFFDSARGALTSTEAVLLAANYIISDVAGARESGVVSDAWLSDRKNADRFAALIKLTHDKVLSSRGTKDTLALLYCEQGAPDELAKKHGLVQENNQDALKGIVEAIIAAHPTVVADYRAGKEAALQFLIGQGMRASKGSANPAALREQFAILLQ